MLIAHNELGHDPIEGKDYEGKKARVCPLYPGMTCREHVDAAVDIETDRDEELVQVPFIELCPNSWLVPPHGAPIRIAEADQFVAGKIEKQVKALQKELGKPVSVEAYAQVKNALGQADAAIDDEAWTKALRALAGIEAHVKQPHTALTQLIGRRLADIEEQAGWVLEDAQEGDEPLAERVATVTALAKALDVAVYGKKPEIVATMQAWLKKQARGSK